MLFLLQKNIEFIIFPQENLIKNKNIENINVKSKF